MSMPPQGFGSQTGMLPIQPQYNQMHQQQTPPQQHVYATQSSYGSNQVCKLKSRTKSYFTLSNLYRTCHNTINRYTCHLAQIKIKFNPHQCNFSRRTQTVPFMYQRISKRQVYRIPSAITACIPVNSNNNNRHRQYMRRLMVYQTTVTFLQQHKCPRQFHRLRLFQ